MDQTFSEGDPQLTADEIEQLLDMLSDRLMTDGP